MIIPNSDHAFIDIRKLRDYTLNPHHRVGRHKARLFKALLGITQADTEALNNILLEVICTHEAELDERDIYGQRYRLDFTLTWHGKNALIRSIWNIRPDEQHPRLVTCYPLKEEDHDR